MERPLLYLSGPLSNGGTLPIWQQKEHVRFASEMALTLIRRKFAVYCPAWSVLGEELVHDHLSHAEWIENDLPWIAQADALYRLPGDSKGADLEIAHANACNVRVFRDVQHLCGYFNALGRIP